MSSASFSVDALLGNRNAKTFTVDALLGNRNAKTFTVDALLENRNAKTFTVDAVIQAVKTKTFSVDALIAGKKTASFSVDADLASSANALSFTGAATSKMTGSNSSMPMGSSLQSYSVWLKFASASPGAASTGFVGHGAATGPGFTAGYVSMTCGSNTALQVLISSVGGTGGTGNGITITNKFHVAWVWNGSNWALYMNGATTTLGSFASRAGAAVAGVFAFGENYQMVMQDLRVYGAALSASDVTGIYNSGVQSLAVGRTAGLTNWWKTNEGSGLVSADSVGGNNGALANATWTTM
jgi:hypothetical protein